GELLASARIYGESRTQATTERASTPRPAIVSTSLADDRELGAASRVRRRLGATWEILRPFSFTASTIPVLAAGALAWVGGAFDVGLFLLTLVGAVSLHAGTNIVNEVFDVRRGIDTITSPRASHAILKGRISEAGALRLAYAFYTMAVLVGIVLTVARGWPIVVLGLVGLVGGYFYTAPPFEYKSRALGVPLVFLLMGPLMVEGAYYAISGAWSIEALVLSVPVGLLVAAILHGNEWRDMSEDTRAGIVTLSSRIGRDFAHYGYVSLVVGAYVALGLTVAFGWLPPQVMLAVLSLPWLVRVIRAAELGAGGQARAIAMIDLQTARLHLAFGTCLVIGVLASGLVA
ncbi:MAG TPA: prenyltransferase, partial [Candidatus Saccharimonadia bacterium]|nr:prenyltransferase [Candidatus Saccharimonadia bacterium]